MSWWPLSTWTYAQESHGCSYFLLRKCVSEPYLTWNQHLCRFKQVFSLLLSLHWIRRLGRRLTEPERAANAQRVRRAAAAQYSATLKSNSPCCHSPSVNHLESLHQVYISINFDCSTILGWCWLSVSYCVRPLLPRFTQVLRWKSNALSICLSWYRFTPFRIHLLLLPSYPQRSRKANGKIFFVG